jgi:phosphomethylpyrimidine synthase
MHCRGMSLSENLLESAIKGEEVPTICAVAEVEGIRPDFLRRLVASGRVVIMQRKGKPPVGIGEGLRTKINANIGTSAEVSDPDEEVEKARIAEKCGADTITDLSMGGPVDEIMGRISEATDVPLTTVPIYQTVSKKGSLEAINERDIIRTIKTHVDLGISSIVLHAGVTYEMLEELKEEKRIMGMVSKGGAFTSAWMLQNGRENPFWALFDEICEILAKRDVVLSLGNAMRSGCIHDLMDSPQDKEIEMNAELARRANDHGIQVIIEGMGGHVRPDMISAYISHYKQKTEYRPLFVAGPLPIDIGVGHDHISGCVGGALAAGAGADYLCYITPSEHLGLPNADQVREGVVAFKIAAHIGDTLKYGPRSEDRKLSEHRRVRDWEGQFRFAIDAETARRIYSPTAVNTCSMCGKHCAISIMEDYLKRI